MFSHVESAGRTTGDGGGGGGGDDDGGGGDGAGDGGDDGVGDCASGGSSGVGDGGGGLPAQSWQSVPSSHIPCRARPAVVADLVPRELAVLRQPVGFGGGGDGRGLVLGSGLT